MVDLVEEVAEDEENESAEEEQKKGFLTLHRIIALVVVVVLLGAAFPVYKAICGGKETKPDPVYYPFFGEKDDSIMLGVKETAHTRHLQCRFTLMLESEAMVIEIEKRKDEFKDLVISIMQKYPIEELDYVGQNRIRREIEDEFNLQLDEGKVLKVLFTEFIVR